jgi:hypothetical protein
MGARRLSGKAGCFERAQQFRANFAQNPMSDELWTITDHVLRRRPTVRPDYSAAMDDDVAEAGASSRSES